ncbi:hypothetical protein [Ekhidna sp. To15]|uniref:hypothetical protein n=1 Tax=Ekhidna sp. To15 TaxID=3395267 RepID=UPI003F521555
MEILIIGILTIAIALVVWVTSSFNQFKKMNNNPEEFQERRTFKSMSDGSEEL